MIVTCSAFNPDAPRQSNESSQRRLDEYDSDGDQAFSSCSYDPLEQYESEHVDTVPVEGEINAHHYFVETCIITLMDVTYTILRMQVEWRVCHDKAGR